MAYVRHPLAPRTSLKAQASKRRAGEQVENTVQFEPERPWLSQEDLAPLAYAIGTPWSLAAGPLAHSYCTDNAAFVPR